VGLLVLYTISTLLVSRHRRGLTEADRAQPAEGQRILGAGDSTRWLSRRSARREVYGDLFIAEGGRVLEGHRRQAVLGGAKQIVLKCVRRYDRPDYIRASQDPFGPEARALPGACTGCLMVLIRATTQMLATRADTSSK
jgi:hypothetical protein